MAVRQTFQKLEPRKQAKVLQVAIDEFAEHGFRQASVNRMVQRAGIAKGSIFQYFGTKEGLFRYVFDHAVNLVRQSLRRVKAETQDQDFFERIRRSLQAGVGFIQRHPKIYHIYLKMIFQENFPLRTEFLQQVHLFSAEYLRPIVEEGIRSGELARDLDVDMAIFFLDAIMDRFLQACAVSFLDAGLGLFHAQTEQIDRRIEQCVRILRHGLARKTETSTDEPDPIPTAQGDRYDVR